MMLVDIARPIFFADMPKTIEGCVLGHHFISPQPLTVNRIGSPSDFKECIFDSELGPKVPVLSRSLPLVLLMLLMSSSSPSCHAFGAEIREVDVAEAVRIMSR